MKYLEKFQEVESCIWLNALTSQLYCHIIRNHDKWLRKLIEEKIVGPQIRRIENSFIFSRVLGISGLKIVDYKIPSVPPFIESIDNCFGTSGQLSAIANIKLDSTSWFQIEGTVSNIDGSKHPIEIHLQVSRVIGQLCVRHFKNLDILSLSALEYPDINHKVKISINRKPLPHWIMSSIVSWLIPYQLKKFIVVPSMHNFYFKKDKTSDKKLQDNDKNGISSEEFYEMPESMIDSLATNQSSGKSDAEVETMDTTLDRKILAYSSSRSNSGVDALRNRITHGYHNVKDQFRGNVLPKTKEQVSNALSQAKTMWSSSGIGNYIKSKVGSSSEDLSSLKARVARQGSSQNTSDLSKALATRSKQISESKKQ